MIKMVMMMMMMMMMMIKESNITCLKRVQSPLGLCYCRSVGWFRRRNDDFLFHDEYADYDDDDDDDKEEVGGNDYGSLL